MKKICLPITARPHLARQLLLIAELKKHFKLDIWQPEKRTGTMAAQAILYAVEFNNYLANKDFDAVIIRGDRYEMLGLAMVATYRGLKIIHLEGGDTSGVIDNRVRHAITSLADYHFCTNEQSHRKLIHMGAPIQHVWNFGSLDVEYASKVKPKKPYEVLVKDGEYIPGTYPYILVAFHPIKGEDERQLDHALEELKGYVKIKIGSNSDYGRGYGTEQFSPEDYINLMRYACVCVGNSSSLLKEASILGVPVVNVGDRQIGRLKPKNVLDVACDFEAIEKGIDYQLKRKNQPDFTYYQKDTSKKIVKKLREIL